jgi:uncharacterized protein involved in type VI secretion and phage assembly
MDESAAPRRFFGKYRGVVVQNEDPQILGRLMVQVPDVLGAVSSDWALPCVPLAGPRAGFLILPDIGDSVWVEFEAGDPDRPIWTGGFWTQPGEGPAPAPPGRTMTLQTAGGVSLTLSDAPGTESGVVLKAGGAMLVLNETGVRLTNGQGASLTLIGPDVAANNTALGQSNPT